MAPSFRLAARAISSTSAEAMPGIFAVDADGAQLSAPGGGDGGLFNGLLVLTR